MKHLKKILSIEFFVDIILLIFAVSSIATVSEYLISLKMNPVTAYAFGNGIGFVLVALSILLSRTEQTDSSFRSIALTTLAIALFSGYLQASAYYLITHEFWPSVVKGFAMPLICEAALAYSVSLYSSYRKRKEINDADAKFDEQLALMQRDATVNLDPEKIRAEIEQKMQLIITARINKFTSDQLEKYGSTESVHALNTEHFSEQLNTLSEHLNTSWNEQLNSVQKQSEHLYEQLREHFQVFSVQLQKQSEHFVEQLNTLREHLNTFSEHLNTEHLKSEHLQKTVTAVQDEIEHLRTVYTEQFVNTLSEHRLNSEHPLNSNGEHLLNTEHTMNSKSEHTMNSEHVQKVNTKSVQLTTEQKMNILIEHLIEHYNNVNTEQLNYSKLAEQLPIDRVTIGRYIKKLKETKKLNGHVDASLLRAN